MKKILFFLLILVSLNICYGRYCYQENANVTTSCGGLNTGIYNIANTTLAGESTGYAGYLYINYTKPSSISETIIQYKLYNQSYNTTLSNSTNSDCYNADSTKVILQYALFDGNGDGTSEYKVKCWNSTVFKTIASNAASLSQSCSTYVTPNTALNIMTDGNWSTGVWFYRRFSGTWKNAWCSGTARWTLWEEAIYWKFNEYFTTNITSINGTKRGSFTVAVTPNGFINTPTCGVESNSTGLSCTNSTSSVCTVANTLVKEVINLKPFCTSSDYNSTKIYNQSANITFDNTRLKLNVTDINGNYVSSATITGTGISQKTIGNNTYIWGSGTKTLTITKSGYAIAYLNITFTSDQQNETVVMNPNNTIIVKFYDTDGNPLPNVTTRFAKTGFIMTNFSLYNITAKLSPGTYTITLNKTGYENSEYIEILNNNFIILNAYLNPDDDTLARVIYVKDYSAQLISGATVTVKKYVGSTLQTVDEKITDYNGYVTVYLEPTTSYTVIVSHPDYNTKTIGWQPIDSSITINIGESARPDYSTYLDNISYSVGTPFIYLLQNTSYTFNLTIASSSDSLEYYGIWVNNSGDITNNNETGEPSGSTVQVTILTDYNDTVYFPVTIRYYFKQDCCSVVVKEQKLFAVPNSATNHTLTYAFRELRNSLDISDENLGLVAGILVTFITIALIGMIRLSVGISDPTILTLIGFGIQAGWCVLGFFNWFIWSTMFIPYLLYKMFKITRGT